MSKKTVRITIPTASPDDMSDLVEEVWEHHQSLGTSSPFYNNPMINMARYEALMTEAVEKRREAEKLYAEARTAMQESRVAFGIERAQNISNPDTLYHYLDNIKRFLLVKHRGEEESLNPWGFNVVIGSASVGAKKKKKPKV